MENNAIEKQQVNSTKREKKRDWALISDLILIFILVLAGYFRLVGLDWDENHHLHPDERFLTMVETSIAPVEDIRQYFNTAQSSLNPNNRGYGFYVYGTLPLFTVRYIAEWVGKTGYGEVYLVGRFVSCIADLLTIVLIYLTAERLYKRRMISILAAAFSAAAVLQIQLSHYFTVDIFANLFSTLTFYFAVRILTLSKKQIHCQENLNSEEASGDVKETQVIRQLLLDWRAIGLYILFGVAYGMALASKVSVAPLALLLPLAITMVYLRLNPAERQKVIPFLLRNIALAGIVSIITFRIFQPYAFTGSSFFSFLPNEQFIKSLRELSQQSRGNVDFPPALQWARRSLSFGWVNMVKWGMGIPLGLLAWGGFLWMGFRILKKEWHPHLLIWSWTAGYFTWQTISFTSSMRYFLPIYPMLEIIAAWAVVRLWDQKGKLAQKKVNIYRVVSIVLGVFVLLATFAWAFAFSRIYTRPVTRIAASEWIYQNVPSAINLSIETDEGMVNQPLGYPLTNDVIYTQPLVMAFTPETQGYITEIEFSHLFAKRADQLPVSFSVKISQDLETLEPLSSSVLVGDFPVSSNDPRGSEHILYFTNALYVEPGQQYYLVIESLDRGSAIQMAGPITLGYTTKEGTYRQPLLEPVELITTANEYRFTVYPIEDGLLKEVYLPHVVDWAASGDISVFDLSIYDASSTETSLVSEQISSSFLPGDDPRGEGYRFVFENPISVSKDSYFTLQLRLTEGKGNIALYGSKQALESTWDDTLPYSLHGYNIFDYYNGIYRTELNFEMYWDDNQEKLDRFLDNLNQADYLFISSNRQWGTTVRVPERYPLTTAYYRNLLGCPGDKEITWCYSVAEPGMFTGKLGFELVEVFQSDPNLGSIRFNTQFAEEAFTVYDHPKVLIFKKTGEYSSAVVRDILGGVDLSSVVRLTPREASKYQGSLTLLTEKWANQIVYTFKDGLTSSTRLVQQRSGGTWSELFDRDRLINRFPLLGLLMWYFVILLLGWVTYPLTRLVFGGLRDKGYPLARFFGMVLLAFMVWIAGSAGISFTSLTITLAFILLVIANLVIFLKNRREILAEVRNNWKYFLLIEVIFLAVFLFDLLIRLGNPDLWHPYKGGEKPMDFSYFNAVLKSTTFPPYDPWYAGGYINYYYYGFVIVGVLTKWLGIVPSIAYNFILPTLMAVLAMGTFTLGSNLVTNDYLRRFREKNTDQSTHEMPLPKSGFLGGLGATLFMVFVGNLGTVRMIWQGLMRLAAPIPIEEGNFFARLSWTFQGFAQFMSGSSLPFGAGDWYWIPSRVYPNEPITEFPLFTFLYADLHAHLIALPITVMALCWAVSFVLFLTQRNQSPDEKFNVGHLLLMVSFGALIVGALRPTNTWDMPTYLVLSSLAVLYAIYTTNLDFSLFPGMRPALRKFILAAGLTILFVFLAFAYYRPFGEWFGQAYTSIKYWEGDRSPFGSYLTHWGLFLFVIISWLFWETREWLATTPVSALNKLKPYRGLIQVILAVLFVVIVVLTILRVEIGWLVVLTGFWAAALLLRPGISHAKRIVLFLIGTALALTLAVELIQLEGDLGRMNTVFKFYLQAWTLFSISAACAFMWLIHDVLEKWKPGWRAGWQVVFAILLGSAVLFTIMGGSDKIRDRMTADAPHTLDGMTYMAYSQYYEGGMAMNLEQDYQAILWMQENVEGSPVIVEANTVEYHWGSRFTIYTGLPGVVGWNWHQRQQRALAPSTWVTDRVDAVGNFYRTLDREQVEAFLDEYDVQYIIVGQLERAYYGADGLLKFNQWNGDLWTEVYHSMETTIYRVNSTH